MTLSEEVIEAVALSRRRRIWGFVCRLVLVDSK